MDGQLLPRVLNLQSKPFTKHLVDNIEISVINFLLLFFIKIVNLLSYITYKLNTIIDVYQ